MGTARSMGSKGRRWTPPREPERHSTHALAAGATEHPADRTSKMSLTPASLTPIPGPVSERRPWVTVVETPVYLARAEKILDEGQRQSVVDLLTINPEIG